jgi:DNA-directed RNA polymerase specialized sigma subunit
MYENKDFTHESAKRYVTDLHVHDMDFCSTAMWIPSLRDIITQNIVEFVTKSSATRGKNHSGLTHFVTGTRMVVNGELHLHSIERSAKKEHKEFAKDKIDLILGLLGMHIKAIEEAHALDQDATDQYAEVGSKLKYLNLHQSVRSEMYKKAEEISNAVMLVYRKAQSFTRKNIPMASISTVHSLISGDVAGTLRANTDIDEYAFNEQEFYDLRRSLFATCLNELQALMDVVGVESIEELTSHWEVLYATRSKFQKIKTCRNNFVTNNTRLVLKIINAQVKKTFRYLDKEARKSKADSYYAQTIMMLLEKVYKYNPEHCFATFAVKYIEQECQLCIAAEDIVKLPPVYANLQAEVLKAGITVVNGKENFSNERALSNMRQNYPDLHWDTNIIADVRFKQSTKSTVSIHENDDDDDKMSLFHRLECKNANPEAEASNVQWAQNVVGLLKSLPQVQRNKVINRVGFSNGMLDGLGYIKAKDLRNMTDEECVIYDELIRIADS